MTTDLGGGEEGGRRRGRGRGRTNAWREEVAARRQPPTAYCLPPSALPAQQPRPPQRIGHRVIGRCGVAAAPAVPAAARSAALPLPRRTAASALARSATAALAAATLTTTALTATAPFAAARRP